MHALPGNFCFTETCLATRVHDTKCNACMITLLQEIHLVTNVNYYPSAIGLGNTVGFETQKPARQEVIRRQRKWAPIPTSQANVH
jgi:hypothetical protein